MTRRSSPPRLVVRTSVATLATVAVLLSAVFVVVTLDVRERVRAEVTDKLEARLRVLSALEDRRGDELASQVAMLAENSTLKAALDIYQSEMATSKHANKYELVSTVTRELEKIAARVKPDILAVTDASGRTVAAAGRLKAAWPDSMPSSDEGSSRFVSLGAGAYRLAGADVVLQDTILGRLQLGTALDKEYARELSALSGAATLIATSETVLTTTLPPAVAASLTPDVLRSLSSSRVARLGDSEYAVRELLQERDAGVYVLDSIDAASAPALMKAGRTIFVMALATFALAGLASVWLARTLARPIDSLSRSLEQMTRERAFDEPLPKTGFSREIDALTASFNEMMSAIRVAEGETRSAYVGTIRALAMTLDARDPYTAGHSERVSALSVAVGRHMALSEDDVEVLRLGALLHDIGKVGVPDDVLRKPGALTAEEFEAIKLHPDTRGPHPPQRPVPRAAHPHRRAAPRAAGRQRLSAPVPRRGNPAARPDRPRHRRLRRDDERARLSPGAFDRRGAARALAVRRRRVRRRSRAGAGRGAAVNRAVLRNRPTSWKRSTGAGHFIERLMTRTLFPTRSVLVACTTVLALSLAPTRASAQPPTSEPWAVEAVVSGSSDSHGFDDPFLLFDVTGTGRVREGLDIIVRPYAHRLTGGDWTFEMYQLQVRYVAPTRVPLRFDAGIIASPLGLNTLELLPSKNPTIGAPFFYFAPLPRFDTRYEGVQLISGGYPLGAIASSSGAHWDARAGITDQSPTRKRNVLRVPGPCRRTAGPRRRRLHACSREPASAPASRAARTASLRLSRRRPQSPERDATMVTVEGEYAIGYTRVTGEWIRDAFDATGRARGRAWIQPDGDAHAHTALVRRRPRQSRLVTGHHTCAGESSPGRIVR